MASTIGAPEIDHASATIQVKPAQTFKLSRCAGEDGIDYETYRGAWAGGETSPLTTDYNLTGSLSVSKIVWTINLKTDYGVLRGTATLMSQPAAGGPTLVTYSGPLTLVTVGLPDSASNGVQARGWVNAATYNGLSPDAPDGGSLLANVELNVAPALSATGEFGTSMGFQDFSVADNNKVC
jgi:hypothetical protein